MADIANFKCPNCGGEIKFNPKNSSLQCESCDSIFTEQQLNEIYGAQVSDVEQKDYEWKDENIQRVELEGFAQYVCKNCGAEIAADENTAATACPYCGSPVVMSQSVSGFNKPDYVLPFKLDKKAAIEALRKHYTSFKLVPNAFNPDKHIDDIRGVYVPFWLFDSDIDAHVDFLGTRTRTWSDKNYNYTETTEFNCHREGRVAFKNIPADASSKMEDEYMDGIEPFDFSELREFSPAFLSGFLADKYDVTNEDCIKRAEVRYNNTTNDTFAKTVQGFTSVAPLNSFINPTKSSYKYAMLPVWIMTAKYKDKVYKFAVNGQTGVVAGNMPYDKGKLYGLIGGVSAAAFAALQLLWFIL